jgi:tripartite-type tricarboxylate transporter receptor subunit TctC
LASRLHVSVIINERSHGMPVDRYRPSTLIAGAIGFLAVMTNGPLIAQSSKHAPLDKTVNLIVGMPPGGSVDAYARLIQRHIGPSCRAPRP